MTRSPSLSIGVVVTVHNRSDYLANAIGSLMAQSRLPERIIIVDDGSTDPSVDGVLESLAALETVQIERIENRGLAGARNLGRSGLDSDLLLFLDDDDEICPAYLERTAERMEDDPTIAVAYTQAEFFGDLEGAWDLPPYDPVDIIWQNMVYSAALIRAQVFDQVGGYDESLWRGREDHDLWIRITAAGHGFSRVEESLFRYRQTGTSMNHSIGGDLAEMGRTYGTIMRNSPDHFLRNADHLWEQIHALRAENRRYRRLYGRLDENLRRLRAVAARRSPRLRRQR
ncbi:glycosyltransferase family 2 protein [Brachybacterium sp. UMB0905]|uniref:glycosyltransferase family 2 protein n=1 Tax=Brachybacterium sp. UMB0905 TaxID=2069310 RepID=UPI000C80F1E1|nr:glycosyltransferase family A protein [Brachybacterium sp. UMB0905]PMC74790.1 hypothetical protein CJ197_11750 [Brachybacterium sp. UMB0905]